MLETTIREWACGLRGFFNTKAGRAELITKLIAQDGFYDAIFKFNFLALVDYEPEAVIDYLITFVNCPSGLKVLASFFDHDHFRDQMYSLSCFDSLNPEPVEPLILNKFRATTQNPDTSRDVKLTTSELNKRLRCDSL